MKIREFLQRNEIYFTTVSAVSLAVISILLTIQGNRNSKAQTTVAERQEKMEYFSNLPTFQIDQKWFWNNDTTQIIKLNLEVSKLEGNAKNIFVTTLSLLNVEYKFPKSENIKDTLQIEDYFLFIEHTGQLEGKICTIKGILNNIQSLSFFKHNLRACFARDSAEYANMEVATYVAISYTNFINETIINFYKLSPIGGSLLCDEFSVQKVSKLFNERNKYQNINKQISITGLQLNDVNEFYVKIKTTANTRYSQ